MICLFTLSLSNGGWLQNFGPISHLTTAFLWCSPRASLSWLPSDGATHALWYSSPVSALASPEPAVCELWKVIYLMGCLNCCIILLENAGTMLEVFLYYRKQVIFQYWDIQLHSSNFPRERSHGTRMSRCIPRSWMPDLLLTQMERPVLDSIHT
jgi:hypothetical protein